jgi:hypothetical protein
MTRTETKDSTGATSGNAVAFPLFRNEGSSIEFTPSLSLSLGLSLHPNIAQINHSLLCGGKALNAPSDRQKVAADKPRS